MRQYEYRDFGPMRQIQPGEWFRDTDGKIRQWIDRWQPTDIRYQPVVRKIAREPKPDYPPPDFGTRRKAVPANGDPEEPENK